MKIKVDSKNFKEAINKVSKAISKKGVNPILSNLIMTITEEYMVLFATNLEVGIKTRIPLIESDDLGTIAIPAKLLQQYVSKLPDSEIMVLEVNEKKLKLQTQGSKISLNTVNPEEYPSPEETSGYTVDIPGGQLRRLLEQSVIAVSKKDEDDPAIQGVKLENNTGFLNTVATNLFRLSHSQSTIEVGEDLDLILPQETINILTNICSSERVSITYDNSKIVFNMGNTKLYSSLITGDFPGYINLIPDSIEKTIDIESKKLEEALKRTLLITENDIVTLKTIFGELNIIGEDKQRGSIEEVLKCDCEKEIVISLDGSYLQQFLSKLESDKVVISIKDSRSPIGLKGVDNNEWLYIIMPSRI